MPVRATLMLIIGWGWMALAKQYLGAYEDAFGLYRRSIELNPNYLHRTFALWAATLGGTWPNSTKQRAEVKAALALDPNFTLRRCRDGGPKRQPGFFEATRTDH